MLSEEKLHVLFPLVATCRGKTSSFLLQQNPFFETYIWQAHIHVDTDIKVVMVRVGVGWNEDVFWVGAQGWPSKASASLDAIFIYRLLGGGTEVWLDLGGAVA